MNFSYRDNLWDGADLLATGIASFGHVSGVHYQNSPEWDTYTGALLDENRIPLGRAFVPTAHQLLVREMILKLKKGYLDIPHFRQRYGVDIVERWRSVWEEYRQAGWLNWDDSKIELTMEGCFGPMDFCRRFSKAIFRGFAIHERFPGILDGTV